VARVTGTTHDQAERLTSTKTSTDDTAGVASVTTSGLFSFPDPVDEVSARLVAAGVVAMATATIVLDQRWLIVVITYGFLARVLTGPKLSPLGLLVTKVITPRLGVESRPVPGPPKRFAQAVGLAFSATALILAFGWDRWATAQVVLGLLAGAAFLEAAFGLCLGCRVFALLMRIGVIPPEVCERCNDIRR
jgi:hypothetical protein